MEHPGSGVLEFSFRIEDARGNFAWHCTEISKAGVNIVTVAVVAVLGEKTPTVALAINEEDADAVRTVLDDIGVGYRESELHAVEVRNTPGGLAETTTELAKRGWNLRSIYMLRGSEGGSHVLMGVTKREE